MWFGLFHNLLGKILITYHPKKNIIYIYRLLHYYIVVEEIIQYTIRIMSQLSDTII